MNGKLLTGILLGVSLAFGGALWYVQNYAYYYPLELQEPAQPQVATAQPVQGTAESDPAKPGAEAASPTAEQPAALDVKSGSGDAAVDQKAATQPSARVETDDATPPDVAVDPAINTQEIPDTTTKTAKPPALPTGTEIASLPDIDLKPVAPPIKSELIHGLITLRITRVMDGAPETIAASDFKGIDADTSPLKFRACFTTGNSIPMLTETYVIYDNPTPLKAPGWFGCFDNAQLSEDLESGTAIAFLGEANIKYGVDRVVAVYDDGRSFAWNQFNICGTAAFNGDPLPVTCPPQPER